MEKRSIHAKKRVSIYTLMSYVSHVCNITYKTYDIQNYILLSRGMVFKIPFLRDLLVSCFGHCENEPSLVACASSHWANHRSVFKGIRFNPCQNLCPQRHSKVCFKLLKTFWVTPKRHCPSERKFLRSRSYRTSPASIILLFYLTWFYVIFR